MCKSCGYDPYLAGKTVLFPIDFGEWIQNPGHPDHTDHAWVENIKVLTGVCVRHHKGWVTIRTKKNSYQMRDEEVIAYYLKGSS